jgi:hypothetical protein
MTTFNGFADIRGVGTACTVAVGGYASVFMDSAPVAHRATVTEHVGADGSTCSIVHSNEYIELTIAFRPVSSVSKTAADGYAMFLPKGSTVALTGFKPVKIGTEDILNSSDWILVGDSTVTLNANDAGVVDLTIRNYLDHADSLKTQVPAV